MKRLHGQHNEKVCNKLNLDPLICNDWIVTTAFYSAIHFLDHALFPCTLDGENFQNISEAHKSIRSNSKHQTRGILLSKLMDQHYQDYLFLQTNSQNARYVNYDVNEAISNRAVSNLNKIISSYNKEKKEIKK